MCGIVAYVGSGASGGALPVLLEGLKRLEYRGYDSAGVAVVGGDRGLNTCKAVGRVSVLEAAADRADGLDGALGIAHTRWATHGKVTEANAHPHTGQAADGTRIALVHNGTIENYAALRTLLEKKGHVFTSETDTEVLAKLIAEMYGRDLRQRDLGPAGGGASDERRGTGSRLERALRLALREVTGAYAVAAVCDAEPTTLVAARKGSPLIVGVADGAYVVASDGSAIVSHTSRAVTLDDGQVVRLQAGPAGSVQPGEAEPSGTAWSRPLHTTNLDAEAVSHEVSDLEFELEQIELGGYPHYMLKEIMEQPETLRTCLRGRVDVREGRIVLGGLNALSRELVRAKRFVFTGQGTAYHAGLIGEYLMEDLAKLPSRATYASEFRYRNPLIEDGTVIVAVSQSGETADTMAALQEAKERGALALGAVNVVGSTMARETDAGVYLRVGPEIGVASTKAFVGQVAVLTMLAMFMGKRRVMSQADMETYLEHLDRIPEHVASLVQQSDHIKQKTAEVVDRDNWLFLGRGYNYPVALEGALKLKEISYIHAEGMPAAEMKHGPIALIDEGMPVVFIATRGSQYDKVMSNIEEVRARGGRILAVATEGDTDIDRYSDAVFRVPDVPEPLQPLLTVVPLQLLSYHAAVLRGHDVDKPRNLAKSVTVE
ncbi:MAG: glutamine--fructose-6-phosphate transaminase (isomerizing) [Planctomycetota bacterium]